MSCEETFDTNELVIIIYNQSREATRWKFNGSIYVWEREREEGENALFLNQFLSNVWIDFQVCYFKSFLIK